MLNKKTINTQQISIYKLYKEIKSGSTSKDSTNTISSQNKSTFTYDGKKTNYILNNIISLLIYISTYFIFYYTKRSTFHLEPNYIKLFEFLIVSLIIGSLLSNKITLTIHHDVLLILRKLYISLIISIGSVSILLYFFDVVNISRYIVLGSMLTGFILEAFYYYIISEKRKEVSSSRKVRFSIKYFITDLFLLLIILYYIVIKNIGLDNLNEKHWTILIAIFVSWIFAASITHNFNPIETARNKWHGFGLQIKFYTLIISLVGLAIFLLQLRPEYLKYFIDAIISYSVTSFFVFIFLFAEKITNKTDEVTTRFLKTYELKGPAISSIVRGDFKKYRFKPDEKQESTLKQKLQFEYLKDYGEVFNFLDRKLDLKTFDTRKTFILRSADPYNTLILPITSYQLIINLHELNDLRRINDYLRIVNNRLLKGGVFVGALIPNKNRYKRFLRKYPYLVANIFTFIDFIWKRAFPKMPVTRNIYSLLNKGKDRALSLAEGLGRLVYCGFEILDLTEINEVVYFVARKAKDTTTEKNPNYSPIFKMKRIGKDGKIIYVYKLRTMHPYSEYIQEFIYKHNSLQEGGKFKDDFRIPIWGIILRKLWIDELPMLINWLKGELKFVGVRPISSHYLSLYSKKHQELRKKFKPGLIPPFYADMPKSIDDIEKSESIYFNLYEKHPIKTDIKYFFKAMNNIILKKQRST